MIIRRLDREKRGSYHEKDERRAYGLYYIYWKKSHFIVKARREPCIDSNDGTTEVLDIKLLDWFGSEESYIKFKKPKRITHTLQKKLEEFITKYEHVYPEVDNSNWSF